MFACTTCKRYYSTRTTTAPDDSGRASYAVTLSAVVAETIFETNFCAKPVASSPATLPADRYGQAWCRTTRDMIIRADGALSKHHFDLVTPMTPHCSGMVELWSSEPTLQVGPNTGK